MRSQDKIGTAIPLFAIRKVDSHKFTVKSQSEENVTYSVDMQIGLCDCSMGQTGAICKHQLACAHEFMMHLPQAFKSTAANRN